MNSSGEAPEQDAHASDQEEEDEDYVVGEDGGDVDNRDGARIDAPEPDAQEEEEEVGARSIQDELADRAADAIEQLVSAVTDLAADSHYHAAALNLIELLQILVAHGQAEVIGAEAAGVPQLDELDLESFVASTLTLVAETLPELTGIFKRNFAKNVRRFIRSLDSRGLLPSEHAAVKPTEEITELFAALEDYKSSDEEVEEEEAEEEAGEDNNEEEEVEEEAEEEAGEDNNEEEKTEEEAEEETEEEKKEQEEAEEEAGEEKKEQEEAEEEAGEEKKEDEKDDDDDSSDVGEPSAKRARTEA